MNYLLRSDVFNAQQALAPWGIPDVKITCGWHNGNISIIVEHKVNAMFRGMLLSVLEATTTIGIPIVFKDPEIEPKEFSFNFDTAP